nr:MAG TPA: hypothetical protein [Caudoviricetes sp.]
MQLHFVDQTLSHTGYCQTASYQKQRRIHAARCIA